MNPKMVGRLRNPQRVSAVAERRWKSGAVKK
jgi:hypothetical protein